jgi:hypothetical protein
MSPISHLSWRAGRRDAGRKGQGIFANEPIAEGTTVAGFGGHVTHRREFERLDVDRRTHAIQIDEDLVTQQIVHLILAGIMIHAQPANRTALVRRIMIDVHPGIFLPAVEHPIDEPFECDLLLSAIVRPPILELKPPIFVFRTYAEKIFETARD